MRRLVAVSLLAALTTGGCAPTLKETRDRLTAEDRGALPRRRAHARLRRPRQRGGGMGGAADARRLRDLRPGQPDGARAQRGLHGRPRADQPPAHARRLRGAPDPRHASAARCPTAGPDGLFARGRRDTRRVDPLGAGPLRRAVRRCVQGVPALLSRELRHRLSRADEPRGTAAHPRRRAGRLDGRRALPGAGGRAAGIGTGRRDHRVRGRTSQLRQRRPSRGVAAQRRQRRRLPGRGRQHPGPVRDANAARGCLHKGATLGWSPAATEQARRNVLARLGVLLR